MSRRTAISIFWSAILLALLCFGAGWTAGIVYSVAYTQADVVEMEVSEPIIVQMTTPPALPDACPRCTCDPAWHGVNVERAWQRFDSASEKMGNKVDLLMVDALNCDVAVQGWSSAMSHWEAACRGDKEACR